MTAKRFFTAAAVLAAVLLLFAGCGADETDTADAPEAAATAVPTATPSPVKVGEYHVTSVTVVTGPDETEQLATDGDVLYLKSDGTGTLVRGTRRQSVAWTCSGTAFTLTVNGTEYTGTLQQGGSAIELPLSCGEHVFTFGAQDTASDEEDAGQTEDADAEPAETADPDADNIFDADEPYYIEQEIDTDDYITLGSYGAVSRTDATGRSRVIDGDIIILHSAENDPAADTVVSGKGTFLRWDQFVFFRYDLQADGTFIGYWCYSGPDDFTGDFMQQIITGTYDGTTLSVTLDLGDEDIPGGMQYEFVLDETPQQVDDYQYTADNLYGDNFAVKWQ